MSEFNLQNALKQIKLGCCIRIPALSGDDLIKLKRQGLDDGIRPIKLRRIGENNAGSVYSLLSDESSEDDEVQVIEKPIKTIDLLSDSENSSSPMISPLPASKPSAEIGIQKTTNSRSVEKVTSKITETTTTDEGTVTPNAAQVPTDAASPKCNPLAGEPKRIENVSLTNTTAEQNLANENHDDDYRFIPVLPISVLEAVISSPVDQNKTNNDMPKELQQLGNAVSVIRLNPSTDHDSSRNSHKNEVNERITETLSVEHRENDGKSTEIKLSDSTIGDVSVPQSKLPSDASSDTCTSNHKMSKDTEVKIARATSVLKTTPGTNTLSAKERASPVKVFNNEVNIMRSVSHDEGKKTAESSQNDDNFSLTQTPNGNLAIDALPVNVNSSLPSLSSTVCTTGENPSSDSDVLRENSKTPLSSLLPKIRVKRLAELGVVSATPNTGKLLRDLLNENTQNTAETEVVLSVPDVMTEEHLTLQSLARSVKPMPEEIDKISLHLKVLLDSKLQHESKLRYAKRKNANVPEDELRLLCQRFKDSETAGVLELIDEFNSCISTTNPMEFFSRLHDNFTARLNIKPFKQRQKKPANILIDYLKDILYSNNYPNLNIRRKLPPALFKKIMDELVLKEQKAQIENEVAKRVHVAASSSQHACNCDECRQKTKRKVSAKAATASFSSNNLTGISSSDVASTCPDIINGMRSVMHTKISNTTIIGAPMIAKTPTLLSPPRATVEHRPTIRSNSSHSEYSESPRIVPALAPSSQTSYDRWYNSNQAQAGASQLAAPMTNVNRQMLSDRSNGSQGSGAPTKYEVHEDLMPNSHRAIPPEHTLNRQSTLLRAENQTNSAIPRIMQIPRQQLTSAQGQIHHNANTPLQIGTPSHSITNERPTDVLSYEKNRPPPPYPFEMLSVEEKAAFDRKLEEICREPLHSAQMQQPMNQYNKLRHRNLNSNLQKMRMAHPSSMPSLRCGTPVAQSLQKSNSSELQASRNAYKPNLPVHQLAQFSQGYQMPRHPGYPMNGFNIDDMYNNYPKSNLMANQMTSFQHLNHNNQMMNRNDARILRNVLDPSVTYDQSLGDAKFHLLAHMSSSVPLHRGPVMQFGSPSTTMAELRRLTEPNGITQNSVQESFIHSTASPPDDPSPVLPIGTHFRVQDNVSPSGQIPVIESSSSPNFEMSQTVEDNASDMLSKGVENLAPEDVMDFANQLGEVITFCMNFGQSKRILF